VITEKLRCKPDVRIKSESTWNSIERARVRTSLIIHNVTVWRSVSNERFKPCQLVILSKDWDVLLPTSAFAYNAAVNALSWYMAESQRFPSLWSTLTDRDVRAASSELTDLVWVLDTTTKQDKVQNSHVNERVSITSWPGLICEWRYQCLHETRRVWLRRNVTSFSSESARTPSLLCVNS